MATPIKVGTRIVECSAVLFDKDGTLTDGFTYWKGVAEARLRALSDILSLPARITEACRKTLGITPDGRFDPQGPFILTSQKEEMIVIATALYQHGFRWDEAVAKVEDSYRIAESRLDITGISKAIPGARKALEGLLNSGVHTGVVTTDTSGRARRMLAAAGLEDVIETIVGVDNVPLGKPHPDSIFRACDELGVEPSQVVYVGDTPTDMRTGLNAGVMLKIGVLTGAGSRETLEPLADVVLASVAEIEIAGIMNRPGSACPRL
ncbi:MAG TPA: HAD family hydrolase [Firmicutes bacterium]|nr:HAD family hydrolase [Bacillota bacterium]